MCVLREHGIAITEPGVFDAKLDGTLPFQACAVAVTPGQRYGAKAGVHFCRARRLARELAIEGLCAAQITAREHTIRQHPSGRPQRYVGALNYAGAGSY